MITKVITANGDEIAVGADGSLRPVATYYGMSSDPKPTEGVNDADRYQEKDTGDLFIFDEACKQWLPL